VQSLTYSSFLSYIVILVTKEAETSDNTEGLYFELQNASPRKAQAVTMRVYKFVSLAVLLAAFSATASGQQGGVIRRDVGAVQERDIERSAVNFSGPWRPNGATGFTRVMGTVIDIRQVVVPNVKLQLRNLDTGTVEQTLESGENGDYTFDVEDSGTYVVEMILAEGYVVALSNAGSLARYSTLNTVVQLPGRWDFSNRTIIMDSSVTNFFGMSAQTTITAQTLQVAIDDEIKPTDPGRPVSPS
jgi:hypothetical protein